MMSANLTIVTVVLAGLCIGVGIFLFYPRPCEPPSKPPLVPRNAVWKGGCDGGNWIELASWSIDTVRLRIYRDWNGELILDADFVYVDCRKTPLTRLEWQECTGDFLNGVININKSCTGDVQCHLKPLEPVYFEGQ